MKSIHYVSTVSNALPCSSRFYREDPDNYVCKQEWDESYGKAAQRELATDSTTKSSTEEEQLFGPRRRIPQLCFRWTST